MKRTNLLHLAFAAIGILLGTTLTGCEDEQSVLSGNGELKLKVMTEPYKIHQDSISDTNTRAMIQGTTLPKGSQLGVFLVDADGNPYNGGSNDTNIPFTYTEEGWISDIQIKLNTAKGTLYAYYPYNADNTDITKITFDYDDEFLIGSCSDISSENPDVKLTLKHLASILRVHLTGTKITVKTMNFLGSCFYGKVNYYNLSTGNIYSATGSTTPTKTVNIDLSSNSDNYTDFYIYSNGIIQKKWLGCFLYDSNNHLYCTYTNLNFTNKITPGEIYNIKINIVDTNDFFTEDGLYYYTTNDLLTDAFFSDTKTQGIAVISGDDRFIIRRRKYLGNTYYTQSGVYAGSAWSEKKDIDGIINYKQAAGNDSEITDPNGYVTCENNKVTYSPYFDPPWTEGVLSDTNGKSNTAYLINENETTNTIGKFIKNINIDNGVWYVATARQLAIICKQLSSINSMLDNANGDKIDNAVYWTSNEYINPDAAWAFNMSNGYIFVEDKTEIHEFILVKDFD